MLLASILSIFKFYPGKKYSFGVSATIALFCIRNIKTRLRDYITKNKTLLLNAAVQGTKTEAVGFIQQSRRPYRNRGASHYCPPTLFLTYSFQASVAIYQRSESIKWRAESKFVNQFWAWDTSEKLPGTSVQVWTSVCSEFQVSLTSRLWKLKPAGRNYPVNCGN